MEQSQVRRVGDGFESFDSCFQMIEAFREKRFEKLVRHLFVITRRFFFLLRSLFRGLFFRALFRYFGGYLLVTSCLQTGKFSGQRGFQMNVEKK